MTGQHLGLNGQPPLLVTEQLRDQTKIEPLAGIDSAFGDLRKDRVA